jgi:hypothetical protein
MKYGFLLSLACFFLLPQNSNGTPYFIPENECEERSQGNSFHAWPLVLLNSTVGFFEDEVKTFREPQVIVREVKKTVVLRLDRNTWVRGQWVDISEPYPPLSPSELF